MDIWPLVIADAEPTELIQPRRSARRASATGPVDSVLDAAHSDQRLDWSSSSSGASLTSHCSQRWLPLVHGACPKRPIITPHGAAERHTATTVAPGGIMYCGANRSMAARRRLTSRSLSRPTFSQQASGSDSKKTQSTGTLRKWSPRNAAASCLAAERQKSISAMRHERPAVIAEVKLPMCRDDPNDGSSLRACALKSSNICAPVSRACIINHVDFPEPGSQRHM
jgi:hypothetical protein